MMTDERQAGLRKALRETGWFVPTCYEDYDERDRNHEAALDRAVATLAPLLAVVHGSTTTDECGACTRNAIQCSWERCCGWCDHEPPEEKGAKP